MTVKQGRMQISRPVVVASQTRRDPGHEDTMPGVFFLTWKKEGKKRLKFHRIYPLILKVRFQAGPHLISTVCFVSNWHTCQFVPTRLRYRLAFFRQRKMGGVKTPGSFLCRRPKPLSPKSGFLRLTSMTLGLTETGAQNVVIQQLCLNFHSSKLPFFTVS